MKTLHEVNAISDSDKQLLQEIKQVIQGFLPTATILLYGSAARGTRGPESDYDVLVLTDEVLAHSEENRICDAIYEMELEHEVVICALFFTKEEWQAPFGSVSPFFHESVEKDAIVI